MKQFNIMLNSNGANSKYTYHGEFNNRRNRVQKLFNSYNIEQNVEICWILMWAATLRY